MSKTVDTVTPYALWTLADERKTFGRFVQEVSDALEFTDQTAFAKKLGITQTGVARIVSGKRKPKPETLRALYTATVEAGKDPMELIYLWLELIELEVFKGEIKRKRGKKG